jgi:hypothetical protein
MVFAEPFAEPPQPRGERGLVGWWLIAISLVAWVVGHAFDTATIRRDRGRPAAPEAARTILIGPG